MTATPTRATGRPPKYAYDPGPMGFEIRKYRELRGWSQTQLASKAGLTQAEITRIERGARKTASLRLVYLLARCFATFPNPKDPVAGYSNWMGHLSELLMAGQADRSKQE